MWTFKQTLAEFKAMVKCGITSQTMMVGGLILLGFLIGFFLGRQ